MRGLTNEERWALRDDHKGVMSEEVFAALTARGLLVEGSCCGCGMPVSLCPPECDCELGTTITTPTGLLALRLDAAARALTGVA